MEIKLNIKFSAQEAAYLLCLSETNISEETTLDVTIFLSEKDIALITNNGEFSTDTLEQHIHSYLKSIRTNPDAEFTAKIQQRYTISDMLRCKLIHILSNTALPCYTKDSSADLANSNLISVKTEMSKQIIAMLLNVKSELIEDFVTFSVTVTLTKEDLYGIMTKEDMELFWCPDSVIKTDFDILYDRLNNYFLHKKQNPYLEELLYPEKETIMHKYRLALFKTLLRSSNTAKNEILHSLRKELQNAYITVKNHMLKEDEDTWQQNLDKLETHLSNIQNSIEQLKKLSR